MKKLLQNKSVFKVTIITVLFIATYSLISLLTSRYSYSESDIEKWDGVSISTSFTSGNGTEANPYLINNGNDLAYFKQLIEENTNDINKKYFALNNDIDLNNNEFSSIGIKKDDNLNIFEGHFDGQGYTIKNVKLVGTQIDSYNVYGFFSYLKNATVTNLNFDHIETTPIDSELPLKIGLLTSEIYQDKTYQDESKIENISIYNSEINLTETIENENNIIGGIIGTLEENIKVNNIFLNIDLKSNYTNNVYQIINTLKSSVSNIVLKRSNILNLPLYGEKQDQEPPYEVTNNDQISLNNIPVDTNNLLATFNENLDTKYYWDFKNGIMSIKRLEKKEEPIPNNNTAPIANDGIQTFAFGLKSSPIPLHDTGIENNTAFINDLESDYNYYMGLNYTDGRDTGTIPSGENQNKYNDTNLAKVYIKYSGEDILDPSIVGHVSIEEQISSIVYYKYYPVVDGYINIELIDNPFADRPDDKAFNGWLTDYEGATVSLDKDQYVRYAKVKVNDISNPISITFYTSWIAGTIYQMTTNNWTTALNEINAAGMQDATYREPRYEDIDPDTTFTDGGTIYNRNNYPQGAYDVNGNNVGGTRCSAGFFGSCTYYLKATSTLYDPDINYYKLVNNRMQAYTPEAIGYYDSKYLNPGDIVAGYFKEVNLNRNASVAGYYDNTGTLHESGTCNANSCTYYEFMQYLDDSGNVITYNEGEKYYYLVTRDTNIVVLRANVQANLQNTKPLTLTGIHNGNDYRNNYTYTINNYRISAGEDLRIEYVHINCNSNATTQVPSSSSNTTSRFIYGNYYNLKIGRGIISNNRTANAVTGGTNRATGSTTNITRYRLIIESGNYNALAAVNAANANGSVYIDGTAIYGSDIDRITNNNANLSIYYCASGTYGGNLYSSNQQTGIAVHQIIKSGRFGTSQYDYTTGIYTGGQNGGTRYAAQEILVEGGWIFNLLGGPLAANNRTNINDIYINIKGGEVAYVIGGAGRTETYGNRIISITGGIIDYSVFGGSNGYSGSNASNSQGTLSGSTFVYVGGNAQVGNETYINNNPVEYGIEAGSVFGIGNGNANYETIGTALNSTVIIDGSAKILRNVYGGGNYGAVGLSANGNTTTKIDILGGEITGSLYGGGNNNGSGANRVKSTINITMHNGTISGSIYGGSRAKGIIYGDTNVKIYGGTIKTDIYGGGEGGYVNNNNSGTYVTQNVTVEIGILNNENDLLNVDGSVYGGSAYGTVNGNTNSTNVSNYDTNVTVNSGTIKTSVFGGGKGGNSNGTNFTPYVLGDVTVNINGGNIGNVFGGNDAAGSPNGKDIVYLTGGIIGNAYGGGNNTGQNETNIYLQGSTLNNLFGGSNASGTVNTTNVIVTSGNVINIYGGNNIGGLTDAANVTVEDVTISGDIYGGGSLADSNSSVVLVSAPNINNVYGGGEQASVDTTSVTINGSTGKKIFGGSNVSGEVQTSNVVINSGDLESVYGGNNKGGTTATTEVIINDGTITSVFGGGDNAESTTSNITVNNGKITNVYGGGNEAGLETSNVTILGGSTTNVFGGSNNSGDLNQANVIVGSPEKTSDIDVQNVYGGNNKGGKTSSTNVDINYGNIFNVYGGGNEAPVDETNVKIINAQIHNIYGGGNAAAVNKNTFLDIDDSILTTNVFGGGNQGVVLGNTETYITNCSIAGSAYAGGNGTTAIVSGNTTITIDGKTEIGTESSKAPAAGCVFGGGNAAATGSEVANNSLATVNIVGSIVHGNVYGGANTSVVYGKTKTNIGTEAVKNTSLKEDDINIIGTVFGGGEANASGSETYDWDFISVTDAIDILIDGTNYLDNSHTFLMTGSIFGSGNASSSKGTSTIYIKNLGTNDAPSKNISIQRTNDLVIDHSVIELKGIQDRTNEYSDIPYSFNQIDKLTIKNDTTLLLQRNANLLKEFYSGVDSGNEVVPATVDINDATKELTKNVDNRIYINPNNNLNITTNQAATSYGKVTGMTFFGMYNSYSSGAFAYGIYGRDFNYGDSANAGDVIIGGSYVLGLHSLNHDITKDGFYSNYITEDYTSIETKYIDPSPVGDTGYRWIIGLSAINYRFSLTASKYSSLGTYELSMMDFAEGNTTFNVLGFNVEGLKSGVNLIDSDLVPKVTDTEQEANELLGLSMKSETHEWTSYNTTKLLSENRGSYTGATTYVTDRLSTAPSLMFYLYHAKNISLDDELGTVVITMEALVPINDIEYNVNLVTITIDLTAKNYNDGDAYDASISYDKKYEMPSATTVKITNRSQFTAYYSIIASSNEIDDFYGKDNSNYHVLVTDYALPIGTQITMLDYGVSEENPEYYYYTITEDIYNKSVTELDTNNEVTYRLSDFIKMGSTSVDNTYNDKINNEKYYSADFKRTIEEFLFIFDLKETTTTEETYDRSMLFELRTNEDRAKITVLGIRQGLMQYSLYNTSNQVLEEKVTTDNNYLYHEVPGPFDITTSVTYDQTDNREAIINTNYESNAMGLNVLLLDEAGNQASSSMLLGTSIQIDGNLYYAEGDGIYRIKLAGKVSNLTKRIELIPDTLLPPGEYTIRFILFASSDGLHNSVIENSVTKEIKVTVVGDDNTIIVTGDDKNKVVNGETRLNELNKDTNEYNITYRSVLENPNLRISILKRDTNDVNAITYTEVNFNDLFKNFLTSPSSLGYETTSEFEKILTVNLYPEQTVKWTFQDTLKSGTYKLVFKLYDNNQVIEEDNEYVIVKKKVVD